jgi:hypothetical protein
MDFRFIADDNQEKALLRHRELNEMAGPMRQDLMFLNRWMQRTDMGNVYLHGPDSTTWLNEKLRTDLVCLKPRAADDLFYRLIYDTVTNFYHRVFGHHIKVSRSLRM